VNNVNIKHITQQTKLQDAPVDLVISSASCRASWAHHVEPASSSCRVWQTVLFDKLETAKMHGLDTLNVSCHVETWRAK